MLGVVPDDLVSDDLYAAVEAVAVALDALCAAPHAVAVTAALDQAAAAAALLEPDRTGQVLQLLVGTIERCHRVGRASLPQLQAACRAAEMALQIDPRWV
jgi:hypothetical protein